MNDTITIEVANKHYNELWDLIHRLEQELIKKNVPIEELDKIRNEILTVKQGT